MLPDLLSGALAQSATEQLCIRGIEAEFVGDLVSARRLYHAAWTKSCDDYDRCIAAHYMGHLSPHVEDAHRWNSAALRYADLAAPSRTASLLPSLLVNLGRTYELKGDLCRAKDYYARALALGLPHSPSLVEGPWQVRGQRPAIIPVTPDPSLGQS
jgi:hypothetical protein